MLKLLLSVYVSAVAFCFTTHTPLVETENVLNTAGSCCHGFLMLPSFLANSRRRLCNHRHPNTTQEISSWAALKMCNWIFDHLDWVSTPNHEVREGVCIFSWRFWIIHWSSWHTRRLSAGLRRLPAERPSVQLSKREQTQRKAMAHTGVNDILCILVASDKRCTSCWWMKRREKKTGDHIDLLVSHLGKLKSTNSSRERTGKKKQKKTVEQQPVTPSSQEGTRIH